MLIGHTINPNLQHPQIIQHATLTDLLKQLSWTDITLLPISLGYSQLADGLTFIYLLQFINFIDFLLCIINNCTILWICVDLSLKITYCVTLRTYYYSIYYLSNVQHVTELTINVYLMCCFSRQIQAVLYTLLFTLGSTDDSQDLCVTVISNCEWKHWYLYL